MPTSLELMPQPFEWITILAGDVILERRDKSYYPYKLRKTVFDVPAFQMAKYPTTNAQFEVFVNHADGYRNPVWWDFSDDAKEWRVGHPEMIPSAFDESDYPRENVSWYDSMAFCRWLSGITGENITLPTEQQWQRAAQGDTNYIYPWGNKIDETFANYDENIGRTTPVTQYPKGASPYGVMDMMGNVWEWCVTSWDSEDSDFLGCVRRVLRGGSWFSTNSYLCSNDHSRSNLPHVFNMRGFRCVRY